MSTGEAGTPGRGSHRELERRPGTHPGNAKGTGGKSTKAGARLRETSREQVALVGDGLRRLPGHRSPRRSSSAGPARGAPPLNRNDSPARVAVPALERPGGPARVRPVQAMRGEPSPMSTWACSGSAMGPSRCRALAPDLVAVSRRDPPGRLHLGEAHRSPVPGTGTSSMSPVPGTRTRPGRRRCTGTRTRYSRRAYPSPVPAVNKFSKRSRRRVHSVPRDSKG